jgi:hypothetical protein
MFTRQDCIEATSRPGKFEGEPVYAPYFWEITLDGCCDETSEGAFIVPIEPEDRSMFPEIPKRKRSFHVFEDGNGFVYCR